jgi:hypothetical protein
MGFTVIEDPKEAAGKALNVAMNGDSDALKDFVQNINNFTVGSLVKEPGQMKELVSEYAKQESAADKKLLPQLALGEDGHTLTIKAPEVAANDEVLRDQQGVKDLDAASRATYHALSFGNSSGAGHESVYPNSQTAEKALQSMRSIFVADEEKAIQRQVGQ